MITSRSTPLLGGFNAHLAPFLSTPYRSFFLTLLSKLFFPTMTEGTRPFSDEQIAQHLANVQDEAMEGKDLIGPSEDLEALLVEYTQGSEVYQYKIKVCDSAGR